MLLYKMDRSVGHSLFKYINQNATVIEFIYDGVDMYDLAQWDGMSITIEPWIQLKAVL